MTIFIIGPGGVGKTTAGTILATRLQYSFIDLDQEFCNQIENIGSYIKNNNYEKYYSKNSELFFKLLKNNKKTNNIFVLSSGFLANHEVKEFYSLHVEAIKKMVYQYYYYLHNQ